MLIMRDFLNINYYYLRPLWRLPFQRKCTENMQLPGVKKDTSLRPARRENDVDIKFRTFFSGQKNLKKYV